MRKSKKMRTMENNKQKIKLLELQNQVQQQRMKEMIKYSYELKKIGLVDSLRQNIASELTGDVELNKEIEDIMNILVHYLRKKEIDNYLKEKFTDGWQEYRNNILNLNFLDTLEMKLKAGEVSINKVQQIIKRCNV